MKKIILATALMAMVTTEAIAESPIDKGVYSVAGSVSYTRTESAGQNLTSYSIVPSVRYYILPRLAIGASVIYFKHEDVRAELKSTGIGPLVRYHFTNDGLRPFVEAQYSYENADSKSKISDVRIVAPNRSSAILSAGVNWFVARNVALEPSLSYTWRHVDYPDGLMLSSDVAERDLRIGIGVSVFIY